MNCSIFQTELKTTLSPEGLAHLRACPACLELAVAADPDNLFRSLGGEMVPPGGVDQFVEGVLQQVHLRQTENTLGRRVRFAQPYRWAVAAALAAGILGITLTRPETDATAPLQPQAVTARPATTTLASFAAVESYDEGNATIVELPESETADLKVVMIFDETLPVDL